MEKNILDNSFSIYTKVLFPTDNQKKFLLNHIDVSSILSSFEIDRFVLDYIHKIDEIRSGFHTRTFDRLVRREILGRTDVSDSLLEYLEDFDLLGTIGVLDIL